VRAGAAALAVLLLLPSTAPGAAAPHTGFGSRVLRAGAIFAGTVTDMRWEQLDVVIVTHVSFRDVRYIKGGPPQSGVTRLTQVGGKTAEGRLLVPAGLPEFQIGRRYVVLAKEEMGPRGSWIPLAALRGGLFHIERSDEGDEMYVSDSARRPIAGVQEGEIILASRESTEGTWNRRMSEEDFLSAIRKLVRNHRHVRGS
jgi:hypothetical protein